MKRIGSLAVIGILLTACLATADEVWPDETGAQAGFDIFQETFMDVYSAPLNDSGIFHTFWAMFISTGTSNYAGFLFDLQYDSQEMSSLRVSPAGMHVALEVPYTTGLLTGWTLAGSHSSPQIVSPLAVWIEPSLAMASGIPLSSGDLITLFQLTGHAKNTTVLNNGDIDVTISAWHVLHVVSSMTDHIPATMWVYRTSLGSDWALTPGVGHWFKASGSTVTFVPASAFIATSALVDNVAGYGVEHIPEPLSVLMLIAGVGAIARGRRR